MKVTKENFKAVMNAKADIYDAIRRDMETISECIKGVRTDMSEELNKEEPRQYRIDSYKESIQKYEVQILIWEELLESIMK